MSTPTLKITTDRGPLDKIIDRLKKFLDNIFKQGKNPPVKKTPVTATKSKVKPAPKKTAVKKKATTARKR
jgi:hypothetical protein